MNAVWLIARREITTRLRSKAFQIATLVLVVILVGLAVVLKLISGGGGSDCTVGLTAPTPPWPPRCTPAPRRSARP